MISASTCIGTISKSLQFPILFSPQVLLYLPLVCSNVTWNTTSFPPNPVPFPASPLQPTLSPFFWSQDLQKGVFKTPSSLLFPNASQWPSPIPILFFTFSLGSLPSCVFLCLIIFILGVCGYTSPSSSRLIFQSTSCPPTSPALCTCFPLCPECPLHICRWLTHSHSSHSAPTFPLEILSHLNTQPKWTSAVSTAPSWEHTGDRTGLF